VYRLNYIELLQNKYKSFMKGTNVMKQAIVIFTALLLLSLTACKSAEESKGDKAWKAAQGIENYAKKVLELKKAYTWYRQAVKKAGPTATGELKNKYLDATMTRIEIITENGGVNVDVISYLREDMESYIKDSTASSDIRDRYSKFLMDVADDYKEKGQLSLCMTNLSQAYEIADKNKAAVQQKQEEISIEYATTQVDIAKDYLASAKKEKDIPDYIRADYFANAALYYDSTNSAAKAILKKTTKELISSYTAYVSVITEKPDTSLFKAINKNDILISAPTISTKGKTVSTKLVMFNDSYNAVRIKKENFFIEYENGKIVGATKFKSEKRLIDQEHEETMYVSFPKKSGKIKKIIFETRNKEHRSEKLLFY
jgi:hypothetical protein